MECWVLALGILLMMIQYVHGFSTSFSGAIGTLLSSPCPCSGFRAPCISPFSSPCRWGSTGPALIQTRRSKVCHYFMQSDGISKAPKVKGAAPSLGNFHPGSEEEDKLNEIGRKEMGETIYRESQDIAEARDAFANSKQDYGLVYPDYDEDSYPLSVPAFTQTISVGLIGQNLVRTPLLDALLTTEKIRLQEEFNIEMLVRGIAEYGDGSGMMILHQNGIEKDMVKSLWQEQKTSVNLEKFCSFIADDFEHKFIVECSGTMEQMEKQVDHFQYISRQMEDWAMQRFHVLTADEQDTQISHYVLAGVMMNMEHWMEIEELWEEEEEKNGPNTQLFQEGTMEGYTHELVKKFGRFDMSPQDLRKQHIEIFGIDPEEAGEAKDKRVRAEGLKNGRGGLGDVRGARGRGRGGRGGRDKGGRGNGRGGG